MKNGKKIEDMDRTERQAELARLRDELADIEDTHAFTFGKTSVHIGAEHAQSMQEEFDAESAVLRERIARVERLLAERSGPER